MTLGADEDVQKFMFDGHLPRHRQSTVSSTSKSAAAMLTAKAAQIKMEEWKQRLQPKAQAIGRDGADETEITGQNELQDGQGEQTLHGLPGAAHRLPPADVQPQDPTASEVPATAAATAVNVTVSGHGAGSFDANAGAADPGAIKTLAADAANAAAQAFAAIGAASANATTLHATNSHSASASSQEAEQHAPILSLSAAGSSRGALGAKVSSVVKLGASGVRTFHGAASASPSMSPLHIRLPKASPAPLPPPAPPSSHVAIAFGSSLRRTLKSPSPASSLASSHSHQQSAAERPVKPSSPLPAQSASIDRITAPTIASELRAVKPAAQAEGDVGGSGSGSGRPVVLGFRDALATLRRGAEDGAREGGSDAGTEHAAQ